MFIIMIMFGSMSLNMCLKQEMPPKLDLYELHESYVISLGCIGDVLVKLVSHWTILTTRDMHLEIC